jgi:hypothetical protein
MNLLHNEFIKQLYTVILGTLLFTANCAFLAIPASLGGTPGRPAPGKSMVTPAPLAENDSTTVQLLALTEYGDNTN